MGRNHDKFTREQRDAIATLTVDEGLAIPAAIERCRAGVHGLDPFEISATAAYGIRNQEARRRLEQDGPASVEAVYDAQVRAMQELIWDELDTLQAEQELGEGGLDGDKAERLHKIIRMAKTIKPLIPVAARPSEGAPGVANATGEAEPEPSALERELLEDLRGESNTPALPAAWANGKQYGQDDEAI